MDMNLQLLQIYFFTFSTFQKEKHKVLWQYRCNCKETEPYLKQCSYYISEINTTFDIMICTSTQYFSRKEKIRSCKNALKNQIVTLAVFVLVCVLVGSLVEKSSPETSYTFYYAQNKIVNKHTRGVFPPLQGKYTDLFGCWRVGAIIGKEKIDVFNFKNYTVCFEQSGRMAVRKNLPGCRTLLDVKIFEWKAFTHNLFISEAKLNPVDQNGQEGSAQTNSTGLNDVSPSPDKKSNLNKQGPLDSSPLQTTNGTQMAQSVKCWEQKEIGLEYIRSSTVWTRRQSSIFLISEAIINGILNVSIIVLNKAESAL